MAPANAPKGPPILNPTIAAVIAAAAKVSGSASSSVSVSDIAAVNVESIRELGPDSRREGEG